MIARFNKLKLQGKLFVAFGFATLVGSLALGLNVISIFWMENEAEYMFVQIEKLSDAHEAETLIQNMDLAQKSLFDRKVAASHDVHNQYSSRLDTYLQSAYLDADTEQEMLILQKLLDSKKEYDNIYANTLFELKKNAESFNQKKYNELRSNASFSLRSIHTDMKTLTQVNMALLENANSRSKLYTWMSTILGLFVLILFGVVAYIIAMIISRQIHKPLETLHASIVDTRQNKFDSEQLAELAKQPDEIGKLAGLYIDMATTIKQRRIELEQTLKEVTTDFERLTSEN